MAGQLSLFDIASEDEKKEFEIRMPNLDEYDKETVLSLSLIHICKCVLYWTIDWEATEKFYI